MPRLEGKRALVSGAGSGIGRATALGLAREGAHVAILDLDPENAEEVRDVIASDGGQALALVADVTCESEVIDAMRGCDESWGGLDALVCNAGSTFEDAGTRLHDLDASVWHRTLAVNLTGAFLVAKHGLRMLLHQPRGSVVFTGSPTATYGLAPGNVAYSASKAGVHGLVRAMAAAYANDGIRVNAVVPGVTDTRLVASALSDERTRQELLGSIPQRRPASPDEIAAVILFLCSDESTYVTGAFYAADGGLTAV